MNNPHTEVQNAAIQKKTYVAPQLKSLDGAETTQGAKDTTFHFEGSNGAGLSYCPVS